MTTKEQEDWMSIIRQIKRDHPHILVTYSSRDGWANIAYNQHFHHITYKMTWNKISSIIYTMHP